MTALRAAGCDRIYEEKASGSHSDRPELAAALDCLRPGDPLVVWRLDRLGRSAKHLIDTVTELDDRQAGFKPLPENVDTTTATGRLIFHIFAALAEFERSLIVDRTRAGLAAEAPHGIPTVQRRRLATSLTPHFPPTSNKGPECKKGLRSALSLVRDPSSARP